MIRQEIRSALIINAGSFDNQLFRASFLRLEVEDFNFLDVALACVPCFPLFLSEMRSASLLGIIDSMLGLYQGARIVKNEMKSEFKLQMSTNLVLAELHSVSFLGDVVFPEASSWGCSDSSGR